MNNSESYNSVKKRSLATTNGIESRITGNKAYSRNDEFQPTQKYTTREVERTVLNNNSRRPADKEKPVLKEKDSKETSNDTSPLIEKEKVKETKETIRPPPAKKRQNCCLHWLQSFSGLVLTLYLIAAAGLSMLVLIGGTILTRDLQAIKGSVSYFHSNLNAPLIADIQLAQNDTCDQEGYTLLILGRWAGTVEGCYCPNSVDPLTQGTCSSQMKGVSKYPSFLQIKATEKNSQAPSSNPEKSDCQPIYATPPQNLQNWGQNAFCVKYINQSTQVEFKTTCSAGFRSCGNNLCIASSVSCPITSISLESSIPTANNSSKVVNMTDGYLLLKSKSNEQPVVQFGVSFDGKPCLSSDLQPTTNSAEYYQLLRDVPKGCNKFGSDDGAVVLDKMDALTEYKENGIAFNSNYGGSFSNIEAYLFYRQRYQIANSSECSVLNTNEFSSTGLGIQRLVDIVMGCATIVLLLSVFLGMVAGLMANKKRGLNLFHMGTGTNLLLFLGITAIIVSTVVGFWYGQEYYRSLQQQNELFNTLRSQQCVEDQQIQPVIQDFLIIPDRANLLYQFLRIALAVSVATYAGVLFGYALNICQKD